MTYRFSFRATLARKLKAVDRCYYGYDPYNHVGRYV